MVSLFLVQFSIKNKLYQEAHRTPHSNLNIQIPNLTTATLVKINASRDPWTNISTADDKSGLVKNKFLGRLKK